MRPEGISYQVAPMTDADAGEVLTLQRAAYATEAQLYRDAFLPALTQSLGELRLEIMSGAGLVVRSGDGRERLLAAVRTSTHDDVLHIGRLTVAPDLQGRGLGSLLLREVEERSTETWAELFTGHLSEGNLRLYERRGYERTRTEPLHDGVTLVYLRKRLR
ncbi:GNAT family N-acetyltransferase [Naasia lichenicola]|uniref:GNAT family N-acetyltransferase n=1 Tax=Naasia lichenicola TaxID=2565933 RepID=A0A4S4FSH3_9MICO|nr:GNAT family N-acetyltransferase [Naasia lichenicola]THG33354.1 GNAT family N-acetyltransferase [Naasia lichenicola]